MLRNRESHINIQIVDDNLGPENLYDDLLELA
jgi:hypothetical protein